MTPGFSATSIMTGTFVTLSLLAIVSATPQPSLSVSHGIRAGSSNSLNWSGFAVTAGSDAVSNAKGSWIVPAIQGSCSSTN